MRLAGYMARIDTRYVVLVSTAALSVLIVALSLVFFFEAYSIPTDRFGSLKEAFDLAVSKVLLPMFTTLVTAALTYIFGKQLVSALSERIRAMAGRPEDISRDHRSS
jgi:hypothetical protein